MANLLDIIPKNVANTNVLVWGRRCLVLFEAGQPYRLDARSLQTQGMDLLGGAIRPGVPFALGTPALDKAAGQCPAALHGTLLSATEQPWASWCTIGCCPRGLTASHSKVQISQHAA